jgi:hypothetical protein
MFCRFFIFINFVHEFLQFYKTTKESNKQLVMLITNPQVDRQLMSHSRNFVFLLWLVIIQNCFQTSHRFDCS